ncbi:MAG: twin-arginine translocation pathway signal protein [Candidatus Rokubacteria bacterium 13_1_20CM_4_70_14]|nr:MAG: twin-arginine translocation pathway signal protein [Candidatus Rokubacteria bacterium 13_1_20CM_4_70_14]
MTHLSRRSLLAWLGSGAAGLAFSGQARAQISPQSATPLPSFTGPGVNPYWNGVNPFVSYPQKLPLLRMTDRGIQLETPRPYFLTPFTPNAAFYVRYHLDLIPNAVDLSTWRLSLEGNVERPLQIGFDELVKNFKAVSVAAVNQCSGNSRSRFQPRVPGAQWGDGGMGNARWTGVRLRELLASVGIKSGTVQLQFQGLDRGPGPAGKGADAVMKSLDLTDPTLDDALVAYLMNDEPLPMLNGFPIRLVVPGKFGVYWIKHLTWIRALTREDTNYWMAAAYRPSGLPVRVQGIAFSGDGPVMKVEFSEDDGRNWVEATLGADHGPYSFRTWAHTWRPSRARKHVIAVRATDAKGNIQPDAPVWNPGGYLWNRVERQALIVGAAS